MTNNPKRDTQFLPCFTFPLYIIYSFAMHLQPRTLASEAERNSSTYPRLKACCSGTQKWRSGRAGIWNSQHKNLNHRSCRPPGQSPPWLQALTVRVGSGTSWCNALNGAHFLTAAALKHSSQIRASSSSTLKDSDLNAVQPALLIHHGWHTPLFFPPPELQCCADSGY